MAHFLAILFSVFMIYISKPGSSLFSWHPTLMSIGFGLFMFEAILLFSKSSSLLQSADRKTKSKYHWILQLCAVTCIALGFAAIYANKHLNGKPHFVTWHACVGLFAVVLVAMQCLPAVGLIYNNVAAFNPFSLTLAMRKQMHAIFGALVFVAGFATIFLSLYSNFVAKTVGDGNAWFVLAGLVALMISVVVNQVSNVYLFAKKK